MVFAILFDLVLIVLAGYCFAYVHIAASSTTYTDPLGTAFWPELLLGLLIVFLVINIVQIYRGTPKEERNLSALKSLRPEKIIKSRFFWGIVIMLIYSVLLSVTGFLLTSFLMSIAMAYCLGEKRPHVLLIFSFLAVVLIFIIFFRGMGIQLPRGTVSFLRDFALTVEGFLRNIGK